ncbi:molybdopterin dinucleotide binding domain-containing protein [Streptomyces sp. NPDC006463]|uniref:molybdopterin dinucleotide binding domain-containing protein n=1 Tax=Streptomyces sp. NPDC006463 TaxID=3364746 RepID=UPI0036995070
MLDAPTHLYPDNPTGWTGLPEACRRGNGRGRGPGPGGPRPELCSAAPDMWIEVSAADAAAAGIEEGDLARVSTRRGNVRARVRIALAARPFRPPAPASAAS